ncbi:hypothetical protein CEK71_10500 [Methylovulum psychrotolerans]|uniref:Uncharacterized protein n=1 Tax=Methylovulum psychrotolerans TaxID=1704499 RepID=A0A1Z4BYW1_9GAMM|nr:hypothetical protein [Methylovulum psychrotolerans]ASF46468.1 hypothetical protein CEK71_10500 [Methylovulum psychrotolerans]
MTDGKRKNRTLHRLPDLQSRLCNGDGLVGEFKLECLKIKHKTNHFAMRAKLFVKANQMAYEELQKLRAA